METNRKKMEEFTTEREDGTVLYCRKQGEGPGLLLIHGVACDCDYFEAAAELLSGKFTVITYDRRGYSRSRIKEFTETAGGKDRFSLEIQGDDAAAVIRMSGQKSAFVVGSSAGGVISAVLADRHPELVQGLFLHEPFFQGAEGVREDMEQLAEKLRAARKAGRVIRAMQVFIDSMGGVDSRSSSRSLEKQVQDLKNLELFVNYEMESFFESDLMLLERLSAPVWIGVGEGSREGLFHRGAREAAGETGRPLVYVPGYHNFPSDLPLEFAVAVSGVYDMMCQ